MTGDLEVVVGAVGRVLDAERFVERDVDVVAGQNADVPHTLDARAVVAVRVERTGDGAALGVPRTAAACKHHRRR